MTVTTPTGAVMRHVPILRWLPGYRGDRLRGDTVGALTAWAIVVPESVAYAQIAGVPPQNAFYGAPVALLLYAVFGTSRNLVVGATSAAAILSASTVAAVSGTHGNPVELSAALAIVTGVVLVLSGVFRLGFVTNFLAEPALTGFLFGMALIIVVRQLGKIVGTSTGEGNFFERAWHLLEHADRWSLVTIAVGVLAVAALFALERVVPRLPASLVVLVVSIALSYALKLEHHGVEIVGKIPSAVPTPHVPDVTWHQVGQLLGGACGLALVVFAESYSIASRFARQHGYEVDANQELVATGCASVLVGLVRGFAISGSASRTAAVDEAGGRTQMVSVVAGGLVLITAAFLTPLFTQLPEPVLGAIVIVAIRGFLRLKLVRTYWRRDKASFAVAATALVGVLVLDLLPGLVVAVALSLLLFIANASATRVAVLGRTPQGEFAELGSRPDLHQTPGLLVVRPDGALFFGNANRVRHDVADLAADSAAEVVCLVLSASYRLGLPVLGMLAELDEELARQGVTLWLAAVPSVARPQLAADELGATLGEGRILPSVDAVHVQFTSTPPEPGPTADRPREIIHPG